MNYANIYENDLVNGPGVRVSLFVSGCMHGKVCGGCYNKAAQNFNYGTPFTEITKDTILALLDRKHISGLTLSGGDPLAPKNALTVLNLCKEVKEIYPEKDIWCWTGYEWEELAYLPFINLLDVVVCGKFQKDKKLPTGSLYGSRNQYIVKPKDGSKEYLY